MIVCACALGCGAATAQSTQVQIIPAPKQLTPGEGSFSVRDARVVLADSKSAEDQFAAQDFIDDLKATVVQLVDADGWAFAEDVEGEWH